MLWGPAPCLCDERGCVASEVRVSVLCGWMLVCVCVCDHHVCSHEWPLSECVCVCVGPSRLQSGMAIERLCVCVRVCVYLAIERLCACVCVCRTDDMCTVKTTGAACMKEFGRLQINLVRLECKSS